MWHGRRDAGVQEAVKAMKRRGLLLVVVLASLAGCATSPSPTPTAQVGAPVLGISNGTALPVTLFVNGQAVGTATPGVAMPTIAFASLPALPWTVEARSPSGRVLASMQVAAGSVTSTSGTLGRVDLSCGRLTIWAGYHEPSGPPPAPSPGSSGDCAP
jgi:hypothetical protein